MDEPMSTFAERLYARRKRKASEAELQAEREREQGEQDRPRRDREDDLPPGALPGLAN